MIFKCFVRYYNVLGIVELGTTFQMRTVSYKQVLGVAPRISGLQPLALLLGYTCMVFATAPAGFEPATSSLEG
jgi:hypothetical protein